MTDRLTIAMHLHAALIATDNYSSAPIQAAREALIHADALIAAAAEKPALSWVVRRRSDGMVLAQCALVSDATTVQHAYNDGYAEVVEVAAAAPVAPVKFDAKGDALRADGQRAHPFHDGWEAETHGAAVCVTLCLRPGEDAGDLTARIVAAGGRSA